MIELWTARTTNGLRATVMAEECGLPYRAHKVDFDAPLGTRPPEMLAINPTGAIPVMLDHETGVGMSQSFAIMQYMCETSGRFLPQSGAARAAALQWLSFVMTDVICATHPIFVLSAEITDTPPHIIKHYEGRLLRFLGVADARLSQSPWLAGDAPTIADFALYPTAAFRRGLLDRAGGLPALGRWMEVMAARPGVAAGMQVPA